MQTKIWVVAFRNFSKLTAFLWEKPSHMFGLALFLDFKALWSVQCCWAGFLAAQKSFDRDWQAVKKVFDANSHVHAFNHWVVTEKNFPAKKIDPDSSPAEKSNQNWQKKNGKLENHHICWGKKVVLTIIFLCRMVGSQWVFRIKRLVFSIIPSRFLKNQVWLP